MGRSVAWRAQVAACLLLAAFLSACGDEAATDPASAAGSSSPVDDKTDKDDQAREGQPVPAGTPDCSDIWTDGARIPRGYQGCADEGTYVERESLACSSGQRMVRYGSRYYGVIGGTVHQTAERLLDDRDFRDAVRSCRA